ncbi:predicted protein [Chaetomium globosum CBS 148.51]|uniref:Uncharacterized protein n=1 Tax=Chaetomium globosum (strain ATCC 6205 / CBS 148.51 / DSM 1962 / NBRC 6347 / NRRL 1970) TaxID=306901 RepID=Q2GQ04_CHAGB|nr:uncharacterized protein CHGG_09950 [Chaetomium globosum CBS 148.51]EAQ83546.1 predicted protein [Chaetomium globosum CBS 148.51]
MGSKKWQAKRRILNKQRRKARRAAEIAARNAGTQAEAEQVSKVSESASAPETAPQVNKEPAGQKVSASSPSSKPTKPKATTPAARGEIKTINLRHRLRILEKTVAGTVQGGAKRMKQYEERMRKLEQENLLLRADVAALRRGW